LAQVEEDTGCGREEGELVDAEGEEEGVEVVFCKEEVEEVRAVGTFVGGWGGGGGETGDWG